MPGYLSVRDWCLYSKIEKMTRAKTSEKIESSSGSIWRVYGLVVWGGVMYSKNVKIDSAPK